MNRDLDRRIDEIWRQAGWQIAGVLLCYPWLLLCAAFAHQFPLIDNGEMPNTLGLVAGSIVSWAGIWWLARRTFGAL
jgi:hypothetical protein